MKEGKNLNWDIDIERERQKEWNQKRRILFQKVFQILTDKDLEDLFQDIQQERQRRKEYHYD